MSSDTMTKMLLLACVLLAPVNLTAEPRTTALAKQAEHAMRRAAAFFRENVAVHGGYVYHYSPDLSKRWGEGVANPDQIWVQPPGTPTVGMAFLAAFEATGDRVYLDAATAAAEALVYGQLESGGWTNRIDFDPQGNTAQYRNGRGHGRNHSSLDDGQTPSAILLLVKVDHALEFRHQAIHGSARIALDALLAAQFANGGFPQVWTGPVPNHPVRRARYPDYDWRTEGRIKNYWDMYTLNDRVCGYVADTLTTAYEVYAEDRFLHALRRLGEFLILAQMPPPQPAWAQQYNTDMIPIWARPFEPPAIAGNESVDAIRTLIHIAVTLDDSTFLNVIPPALAYLERSRLADGRLARFYELETNRPLYMRRRGKTYALTYSDADLPSHYGWTFEVDLAALRQDYECARGSRRSEPPAPTGADLEARVREIIDGLDGQGRWISTFTGEPVIGQLKLPRGALYISSAVFSENLTVLSSYLAGR